MRERDEEEYGRERMDLKAIEKEYVHGIEYNTIGVNDTFCRDQRRNGETQLIWALPSIPYREDFQWPLHLFLSTPTHFLPLLSSSQFYSKEILSHLSEEREEEGEESIRSKDPGTVKKLRYGGELIQVHSASIISSS